MNIVCQIDLKVQIINVYEKICMYSNHRRMFKLVYEKLQHVTLLHVSCHKMPRLLYSSFVSSLRIKVLDTRFLIYLFISNTRNK